MKNCSVFNIPAGIAFAKALAQKLLTDHVRNIEELADITILLPTRRACRVMREAFLQTNGGKAIILPRLQTIGDVDEEELSLSLIGQKELENFLNLPQSISPLKRQVQLALLIQKSKRFTQSFEHALKLANALGRFMDQIYTENLELSQLKDLVPEDFAEHWQITLDFLDILSENWPKILAEQGVIDYADRRNRLILGLAEYWRKTKPKTHIIAAGTTGSIPAVASLLKVISQLPNGKIILPGLDKKLDEKSWLALGETHPQYGFKQLLGRIDVKRENVQLWNCETDIHRQSAARRTFARELMRPPETTSAWTHIATNKTLKANIEQSLDNLKIMPCKDEHSEAQIIAVMMRELLEEPNKTATLVTPDRNLARRVSSACKRWGITIDDSAGQSLNQTQRGGFFNLLINACCSNLAPTDLLALLKNELCDIIDKEQVYDLERKLLRGPKPARGLNGLREKLKASENPTEEMHDCVKTLDSHLSVLMELAEGQHNFKTYLKTHINVAEHITSNKDTLWHNEDGEALSSLLSEILDQAEFFPDMDINTYAAVLKNIMMGVTVRPKYGTHPRLKILGQLEARLIDSDLVILGGLNEGSWPPDPGHDPWLSRPMRKELGLPSDDRGVGLAAHDFVQGFCSSNVIITHAKRSAGSPTIPARWLQRLRTVLQAAGLQEDKLEAQQYLEWVKEIDKPDIFTPCERPEPRPPVHARPKELPATQIETWLKDPYGVYARYVLSLRSLDPLEQDADATTKGTIIHDVLDKFVTTYPKDLPDNSENILYEYAKSHEKINTIDSSGQHFWWARFERLTGWFLEHEREHRKTHTVLKTEIKGHAKINGLKLTARADRIDQHNGEAVIIDYKSAGTYSKKAMHTGHAPQLPVEALILSKGGFDGVDTRKIGSLEYWLLSGKSSQAGDVIYERDNIQDIIEKTKAGLSVLIEKFNMPETPYYALPRDGFAMRYNDYEHLARVKEWDSQKETDDKSEAI